MHASTPHLSSGDRPAVCTSRLSLRAPRCRTITCRYGQGPVGRESGQLTKIATSPVIPTPAAGAASLSKWLESPLDFLALGPRATLGLASSVLELGEALQFHGDRLSQVVASSLSLEQKQSFLVEEIAAILATLVERGVRVEGDLLGAVKPLLPADVQALLPGPLQERLAATSTSSAPAVGIGSASPASPAAPQSLEDTIANRTRAELAGLKEAVVKVRESLQAFVANIDPSMDPMLKVNARDTRDALARMLQQISPQARTSLLQDAPISAAMEEANELLDDVARLDF
ncbi:hypothetical protein WJX84_009896 [Apatococcus fuscideae]|uniref:Uncharacterized protein n=1 Tax=Apatococcus fuscideae TaxID=2026836 RepID=A0AAW1T1E1_9CHLO